MKMFVYRRYFTDEVVVLVIAAHDKEEAINLGRENLPKQLLPIETIMELPHCSYSKAYPKILFKDDIL